MTGVPLTEIPGTPPPGSPEERRANRLILLCFVGAALGGVGFSFFYWWDDSIQLEGACLGAALLALAAGLIVWAHRLLPGGPFQEEYPEPPSPPEQEAEVLASLDRGGVGRRRVLLGAVGVVAASLVGAVASGLRSFGPRPATLGSTAWAARRRLVNSDGTPVSIDEVPVDSIVTVFPEGDTTSPQVPAMLIRLPPGVNRPLPGRAAWAPEGFVCYSKVCSHAGCPVNLYDRMAYELMCPCHQSTFDARHGAEPVFGPASSPLAQLPLTLEADGTLRSSGDFSKPPGPRFWYRS